MTPSASLTSKTYMLAHRIIDAVNLIIKTIYIQKAFDCFLWFFQKTFVLRDPNFRPQMHIYVSHLNGTF